MVESCEYVIVPHMPGYDQDQEIEKLKGYVIDGHRIISKSSGSLGMHYVLIKFKQGNHAPKADVPPIDDDDEGPIDLTKINF